MKAYVMSEDMGAKDNGAKMQVIWEYFLARSKIKLWKKCL
jgi:hypothetical protein